MARWVAFLRGVNLGGRAVKGPQLISAFSSLKLENISTFLASGNVVFDTNRRNSKQIAGEIEAQLVTELGFETKTFLRSLSRISVIGESNPFGLSVKQRAAFSMNVVFLDGRVSKSMTEQLLALRSDYDDFAVDGLDAFWLCRGPKISDSTLFLGNRLEKAIGAANTMRNMRTLQRLVAKFGTD